MPTGTHAALLDRASRTKYTRTDPDAVRRFWFALKLQGQPVRYEREATGQIVFSATLIENTG